MFHVENTIFKHDCSLPGGHTPDDMNVLGKRLFGSKERLGTIRYYDDDTGKSRFNSKEELDEEQNDTKTTENKTQSANNKGLTGRKLTREQVWRNLSLPKHPKTSIKQLREKIEAEIKVDSWSKSNSLPRVQTLPHLAQESKGLIASADKWDKNNKSNQFNMYLTVPNPDEIQRAKSDENLAAEPVTFETQEVVKFDADGKPVFTGNKLGIRLQRQRSKSLVVSSDKFPAETGTGYQIDLRLLLPAEITSPRRRSESESSKGVNLIVPELKIQTSD